MIVINATWQRVVLGGLLVLPLALIITVMIPALVVLPFFSAGREFLLKLIDKFIAWARIIVIKADAK
ncbi:hypothetical protein [Nonomuraea lactucae]|uniref:hypothetical protein n=1 Tax=Nonomuraea lactucae TaxID=2249762 RepID=UPI0013B35818|nr:hypothetical protein [Nonomuraea lactucae]